MADCIAGWAAHELTHNSRKSNVELQAPRARTRSTHLKLAMQSLEQTKRSKQPVEQQSIAEDPHGPVQATVTETAANTLMKES